MGRQKHSSTQQWSATSAEEGATGSGHECCICCHPGGWLRCFVGQTTSWWWQRCSPGSAEKCTAAAGNWRCLCCPAPRWLRRDMGRSTAGRRQLFSARSAEAWWSRSRPRTVHLLRSYRTAPWLHGAIPTVGVTTLWSLMSFGLSSSLLWRTDRTWGERKVWKLKRMRCMLNWKKTWNTLDGMLG